MNDEPLPMTEDEVVRLLAAHLERNGWTIVHMALAHQRGHDIDARRHGERLLVEAKGGTSATEGTARHGRPFTRNQHESHLGRAVVRAMREQAPSIRTAIAFPDLPVVRLLIGSILGPLEAAGVGVYLVDSGGEVVEGPW